MLRVKILTPAYRRSSRDYYTVFLHRQASSLAKFKDVSVSVIAPHAPGAKTHEVLDGVHINRFRYAPDSLETIAYSLKGAASFKNDKISVLSLPPYFLSFFLSALFHSREASVLHAQWIPTLLVALPLGWVLRVPVTVSVRGSDFNNPLLDSRFGLLVTSLLINRCAKIFPVGPSFEKRLLNLGIRPQKIKCIPNGVSNSLFQHKDKAVCRRNTGLKARDFVVLYVGSMIERKNVDTLISAFEGVVSELEAHLVLIGEGGDLDELKVFAKKKLAPGTYQFRGRVENERLVDWYGGCDVFVLPSAAEGRSNVVMEAMQCGSPVICTDIAENRDLVEHQKNGLLFSVGDVKELRDSMLDIATKPYLRQSMSKASLRKAKASLFSWEEAASILYKELKEVARDSA